MAAKPKRRTESSQAPHSHSVESVGAALPRDTWAEIGESIAGTAISAEISESFIAEPTNLCLSEAQAIQFLDLLDNPPAPNEAMRRAALSHRELIRHSAR